MPGYYEVTIQGSTQGQQIVNRLNFFTASEEITVATALGLAVALGVNPVNVLLGPESDSVLFHYLTLQTNQLQLSQLMIRNIYQVTDFYTVPLAGAGWAGYQTLGAGENLPFVAMKFVTSRTRLDIKAGSLALTAPGESIVDPQGVITSGPFLAAMQDFCDALNAPPFYNVGDNTAEFLPSVFSKQKYEVPDSDPVRYAYRYWPTQSEQSDHSAINVTWSLRDRVTSQTSRRWGKGA